MKLVAGGKTTAEPGQMAITNSGVAFVTPDGVGEIEVFAVGGGGGGGSIGVAFGQSYNSGIAYGGGGGGYSSLSKFKTSPGRIWAITVGSGGGVGINGGDTIFGNGSITAIGGKCGNTVWGGNGGSGGGSGGTADRYGVNGGVGGSDGGNGGIAYLSGADNNGKTCQFAGTGQGTTTKSFGESAGTLYSGGGGGAVTYGYVGGWESSLCYGAAGGGGGGGYGSASSIVNNLACQYFSGTRLGTNGTAGTGGGGGGAVYKGSFGNIDGTSGGSGAVLIRWGY